MIVLRTLTLALLVALLLPWGAYSATMPGTQHVEASAESASDHAKSAKRKCRTGLLPGAPCGPDVVEATGKAAEPAPLLGRIRFTSVRRLSTTRAIRPPTGPPRSA
jgi:hypothetical protein